MKIGYQSLRKISKYFEIFLGIRISHQTIKNWSNKNHEETINNENGTEEYIRHLVECEAFAEYYATMITGNTKAQEYNAAFFPKTCIALSVIENTMLSNISGQHNQAPNPDP